MPLADWSELRWVDYLLARKVPLVDAIRYLEQNSRTRQSAILMEKLGDLYDMEGKPASAIWAYQNALKLKPSLQQNVRLTLVLAEKLVAQQRETEAAAIYEEFIKAFPASPAREVAQQKLAALAASRSKPPEPEPRPESVK